MRDPNKPDTQPDEYLPDLPYAHKTRVDPGDAEGVNPREPSSMPRGEDDAKTQADSPDTTIGPTRRRAAPQCHPARAADCAIACTTLARVCVHHRR